MRGDKPEKEEQMKIPFVSFLPMERELDRELRAAFDRVLGASWYIGGREDEAFEKAFAEYCGMDCCVGAGNGLDALMLSLKAMGIGEGDEVIVPSNTFIATALAVTYAGARPVFVEPKIETFNIDPDRIEAAITECTKAIIPVHLYGQSCDMKRVCAIAEQHGLFVVEDCAQAHGARLDGQRIGTFGTIGCFSFYPTKPLGALGDSGAVVTNDPVLADRLRKLRNYGSGVKYVNELEGVNSRLDEVQAATLQVGLKHLEEGNVYRNRIAERYLNEIRNPLVKLPKTRENATHVYHIFGVLCPRRDGLQAHLAEQRIKALIHYPIPPHMQQCYARLGHRQGDFPISERYANEELSLPIYVGMPEEDVSRVITAVNSFC